MERLRRWRGFRRICLTTAAIYFSTFCFSQQRWFQVPTHDSSNTRNLLRGIAGTSSSDVWVVGEFEDPADGILKNLLMHWNGSGWEKVHGTDLSSTYNNLWDISARAADDVWAVGIQNQPGMARPQVLHWDGTNWSHTMLPEKFGGSFLFAVDAIDENNVWAVGGQAGSPTDPTYVVHYDGTQWTEYPTPNPGQYRDWFNDIDGLYPNDVWAVGRQSPRYGEFHPMIQHWDGSKWSNIALPSSVLAYLGSLESVTMLDADDVWASGYSVFAELILVHWDGHSWTEMPGEGGSGGCIVKRGNDIFGVANWISQWHGDHWTVIDSLNHLPEPSLATAIAFPNGDIWAAGRTYDTAFHTLVYRSQTFDGQAEVQHPGPLVFPNPTEDGVLKLNLSPSGTAGIELFDLLGKSVLSRIENNPQGVISIVLPGALQQGVYVLSVTQNNMRWRQRVVVK